ncbi:ParA family protein [Massilia eburnea]|nr:ParA family protein [Massilia eburnea]
MEVSPKVLKQMRLSRGLTAQMAAKSVRVALRTWQSYEAESRQSFRPIPAGRLELFCTKHDLPYPPTRQDGTMPKQNARIISLLSGTGGSGKTSISLELGRVFALEGNKTLVITNGTGVVPERFTFDNPSILSELNVQLHPTETRELRDDLIRKKVLDSTGQIQVAGVERFIAAGDLQRLQSKECAEAQLEGLAGEFEVIVLDDSVELDMALALSDLVMIVFDSQHWGAYLCAQAGFGGILKKNWEPNGLPQIRSLLVNVDTNEKADWGIHNRLPDFGPPAFHTVLTNAHRGARAEVGHAYTPDAKYNLLMDSAPTSLAAFEYRSLAREIKRELSKLKRAEQQ